MNDGALRISHAGQAIAKAVDDMLLAVAKEPVGFSLFMWTDGRAQYVSNADREEVVKAMEECLQRWREGMPDIPAHEVRG